MDGASAVNTPRQHVRLTAGCTQHPAKQAAEPAILHDASQERINNALRPTASAQRGTYMLGGCRLQEASTWRIVVDRGPLSKMEEGTFGR